MLIYNANIGLKQCYIEVKVTITVRLHISSDPQGFSHRNSGLNKHSQLHGARRMSIHCSSYYVILT